jgi:hypothetical protein
MSELSDLDEINLMPDRGSRSYGQLRRPDKTRLINARWQGFPAWRRELLAIRANQARREKERFIQGPTTP